MEIRFFLQASLSAYIIEVIFSFGGSFVAKHLEKFTKPFQGSRIPFALAEVVTNGSGDMVDLICRFANDAAGTLLGVPAAELKGSRFTRIHDFRQLPALAPLHTVAFSGSAASFSYEAAGGVLTVTCYQVMYGVVGCLLEPRGESPRDPAALMADNLPGAVAVLELSREGLRCLSFSGQLCALTGWSRQELLDRFSRDFSALVDREDWPALLQALLDAQREGHPVDHDLRLLRREGEPLWVNLRAERMRTAGGATVFYAMLLDIDLSRRTLERLGESQAQLAAAQGRLDALRDTLPAAFALLRIPKDGQPEALCFSQRLAELLGYPAAELTKRLRTEPLWRVHQADRETLTAALLRARTTGVPCRQMCRLRTREGQVLRVLLEAVWQERADGEQLFLTCVDMTREQETAEELRLRTQLCDLLLDRSHIVSLDYDPAADTAHVETYDAGGHRSTRRVERYLQALESSPSIHPEDRGRLITALRRTAARPGAGTLEYRGNYSGQGWRWYRASLVSLFDSKGNVYGLLGKAEDISDRQAAAQRFGELGARFKKQARSALAAARLDLTADRILDSRSVSRYLTGVLFGNSADACLRHIRDNIPDPDQQAEFDRRFRPIPLLEALSQGNAHHGFEHRFSLGEGKSVWVRSMLELAEDPESRHVEAFYCAVDISAQRQRAQLTEALALRDYDFILSVEAASGACRLLGGNAFLPPDTTYRSLAARYIHGQAPGALRARIRRAVRLDTILAALEESPVYTFTCTLETEEGPRAKRLRCSWLDRADGTLLVTLGDA